VRSSVNLLKVRKGQDTPLAGGPRLARVAGDAPSQDRPSRRQEEQEEQEQGEREEGLGRESWVSEVLQFPKGQGRSPGRRVTN
jgi:hypothetical protein